MKLHFNPASPFVRMVTVTARELGIIDQIVKDQPGNSPVTLVYKVFRDGFRGNDIGGSSAQSVVLMIFVLLAVLFRSYMQPVIVMTAIPFGLVGAIWGHLLMGLDLTLISMFGVVALTGVVVNDSLLMIDFINRARREGQDARTAIVESGVRRFRPIILTSVTTFAGLTPLLLERSLQARFLIPMAAPMPPAPQESSSARTVARLTWF